jgi:FixJ family two-component response regulator
MLIRVYVLLVDDSPLVRTVLARELRALGIPSRELQSLAECMNFNDADCVCAILDLDLDSGTGVAAAALLRQSLPDMPVAFFTASEDVPLLATAQLNGPVYVKPRALRELLAWTRNAWNECAQTALRCSA